MNEDDLLIVIGRLYMESLYQQSLINGLKEQNEAYTRERELYLAQRQAGMPVEENGNGSLTVDPQPNLVTE
jgi:hypothetical protein